MPLPNETEKEFLPRCIKYMHDEGKDRPHDQIVAICYQLYRNKKKTNEELIKKIDHLIK